METVRVFGGSVPRTFIDRDLSDLILQLACRKFELIQAGLYSVSVKHPSGIVLLIEGEFDQITSILNLFDRR